MPKTTIQIDTKTRDTLKGLGTMEDSYDTLIAKLVMAYKEMQKRDFFTETQHTIAKTGKFMELD